MNRKNLAFASTLVFGVASLSGCSKSVEQVNLDFGRLYDSSISDESLSGHVTSLTHSTLEGKISNEDSFVLLICDIDSTCTCFATFRVTLISYLKNKNLDLYTIKPTEFDGGAETHDLKISAAEGYEDLAIFSNGSLKYQNQRNGSDDSWSNDYSTFADYLKERVSIPSMLKISKDQLETLDDSYDHYVIIYSRESCPDCSYLSKNFLRSFNKGDWNTSFIIDCDVEGIRYKDGAYDAEQWKAFKDQHGLSNVSNTEYGYDVGYVPTLQFVSNGSIEDMAVYFNDSLSANNDGSYKVSMSYWNGSREHNFFSSLANEVTTNFNDIVITSDQVSDGRWNKDAASKYHDPLVKGFLSFYLSKE